MNADEKLKNLNDIKQALIKKIYTKCLESNIDPSTFDYKRFIVPVNEGPMMDTLGAYCYRLDVVEQKIQELQ